MLSPPYPASPPTAGPFRALPLSPGGPAGTAARPADPPARPRLPVPPGSPGFTVPELDKSKRKLRSLYRPPPPKPVVTAHSVRLEAPLPAPYLSTYETAMTAFQTHSGVPILEIDDANFRRANAKPHINRLNPTTRFEQHTPIPLPKPKPETDTEAEPEIPIHARDRYSTGYDQYLLYGGLPPGYGQYAAPPMPVLLTIEQQQQYDDELRQIEEEERRLEEEYAEEEARGREPSQTFMFPQRAETEYETAPLYVPPRPTYKTPAGRTQPYLYVHHAPMSPVDPEEEDNAGGSATRRLSHLRAARIQMDTGRSGLGREERAHYGEGGEPPSPRTAMAIKTFQKFDKGGKGFLNVREFYTAMKSMGLASSFADAENLFNTMDEDGNGEMSQDEFLDHCREYLGNVVDAAAEEGDLNDPATKARRAFQRFDKHGHGYLTVEDFLLAIRELGLGTTEEDAEQMFSMVDEDGSGTMDEEEFVSHCLSAFGNGGRLGARLSMGDSFPPPATPLKITGNPTEDAAYCFRRYDEDGNGFLDIYEFVKAMKELGLHLTFEESKAMFSRIDVDGSGTMDEEEFTTHYINHVIKQGTFVGR